VDVLQASVENNAWWCHAVCASDGILGHFGQSLWSSPTRTPPLYPDAITLTPRVSAAHVAATLDRTRLGYSVKDSFADLDLTAYGLNPLFGASWISLERAARSAQRGRRQRPGSRALEHPHQRGGPRPVDHRVGRLSHLSILPEPARRRAGELPGR